MGVSGRTQARITKWCDPWEAFWARVVAYTLFGWFFLQDAASFAPWKTGTSWGEIFFALVLFAIPIVTIARSLPSVIVIDSAGGRIEIKRVSGFGFPNDDDDPDEDRFIQIADVKSVILKPQRRATLIWPYQLQLLLRDGRRVPVSTISSYEFLMAGGARRLAQAINCSSETEEYES